MYLHEKHAAPRMQELMSHQIDEALGIEFDLPVPGSKIVHRVSFVLGDVSNGDTPMLGYYAGVLYQSHQNNSPCNGDPRARYCYRNTIHRHFVTLGDGEMLSREAQRWMAEQLALLPPGLQKGALHDEEARIMRFGRLFFANRMDCPGPLKVQTVSAATLVQTRALRVYPDSLHAMKETFKSMTYLAEGDAREYVVRAGGVREVVPLSKTKAQLALKSKFRGTQEASNRARDDLWGRDFVKIFGQREAIYSATASTLFMATAGVMVLANKLVSAGHRTMCKPQNVALRDLVTLAHIVGFRGLCGLQVPGSREYKHMFQVHNQMYSIAWPYQWNGRDHTAQCTEGAVHDLRAHVNSRGAASQQAMLTSHVQNSAILRAGHHGGKVARADDDYERGFPLAIFFHSCVTGFDVRSMREFAATLRGLPRDSAAYVFARTGAAGVLWVSTTELASTARGDVQFAGGPNCMKVCFCKSKDAPTHSTAWDDFMRQSTLATYLEAPWCHPVDKVCFHCRMLLPLWSSCMYSCPCRCLLACCQ